MQETFIVKIAIIATKRDVKSGAQPRSIKFNI